MRCLRAGERPTKRPPTSCRRSRPGPALRADPHRLEDEARGAAAPRAAAGERHHQPVARGHRGQALADQLEPRAGPARVADGGREPAQEGRRVRPQRERHARLPAGLAGLAAQLGERLAQAAAVRLRVEVVAQRHRHPARAGAAGGDDALHLDRRAERIGRHHQHEARPRGQPGVGLQQRLPLVERAGELAQERRGAAVHGEQPDRPGGRGGGGNPVEHAGANDATEPRPAGRTGRPPGPRGESPERASRAGSSPATLSACLCASGAV